MNGLSLWWRLRVCFLASALNLSFLLIPHLQGTPFSLLVAVILSMDAAACWIVIKGVPPSRDGEQHRRLAAFAKNCIYSLGYGSAIAMVVLALLNKLDRQDTAFALVGYAFFWLACKMLIISMRKGIDELTAEPSDQADH